MRKRLLALAVIAPLFALATGCDDGGSPTSPANAKKNDPTKDTLPPTAPVKGPGKKNMQGQSSTAD